MIGTFFSMVWVLLLKLLPSFLHQSSHTLLPIWNLLISIDHLESQKAENIWWTSFQENEVENNMVQTNYKGLFIVDKKIISLL